MTDTEMAGALRHAADELNALVWNAITEHKLTVSVTVCNDLQTMVGQVPKVVLHVSKPL